jgi:YfiH family protein
MHPLLVSEPRLVAGPVTGGITTRRGFPAAERSGHDDPAREESRSLLAGLLGSDPGALAWLHQVHGNGVIEVDQGGCAGQGDALVTRRRGLALLVAVADCGPVLLADPASETIAIAHAGWRGTLAGICERTVAAMGAVGAAVSGVRAWIGPCIGPEHFEVGEEVAERFDPEFVRRDRSRPHVDLPRAIASRLEAGGVPASGIRISGQCTYALKERYWSYRRDGGICGRQWAWITRPR